MAVIEDKRLQDTIINSEPQLIAEAIVLHQANMGVISKKRKLSDSSSAVLTSPSPPGVASDTDSNILGVRVTGVEFYFYIIPVSDAVIGAMATQREATAKTTVFTLAKCDGRCRFDWSVKDDRKTIIEILDAFNACIRHRGSKSK